MVHNPEPIDTVWFRLAALPATRPELHPAPHKLFRLKRRHTRSGDVEEVTRDGVPIRSIFRNGAFGYRTITVERTARDAAGNVVVADKGQAKGKPVPDSELLYTEKLPLH